MSAKNVAHVRRRGSVAISAIHECDERKFKLFLATLVQNVGCNVHTCNMETSILQVLVHPTSESVLLDINPVCVSGSHPTVRNKHLIHAQHLIPTLTTFRSLLLDNIATVTSYPMCGASEKCDVVREIGRARNEAVLCRFLCVILFEQI